MNNRKQITVAFLLPILLLVLLFAPFFAYAAKTLVLSGSADTYPLGGSSLDILEDKTGKLTIADVASSRFARSFKQSQQQVPNFGFADSAFWFRFTVDPGSRGHDNWLLLLDQPLVDEVDLYVPRGDGSFEVKSSGDTRPMSVRELPERAILLPLPRMAASRTFYLRAWVPGRAIFPFSVLTKDAYRKAETLQSFIIGGYSGFMLSISLLGLFLFLLLKNRTYFLYMLYVLGFLLSVLMANGYLPPAAIPEHPWLHHYSKELIWSIALLAGTAFSRNFLKTAHFTPRLDPFLKWFIILYPFFIVLSPLIPPLVNKMLLNDTVLVTSLATIVAAVACYRQGHSAALYFLYARCSIFMAAIVFSLVNMGFFPVNIFIKSISMFASMIDVIFISLALGDNFKEMNRRITTLVDGLQVEVGERTAANRALEEQMVERKKLEREIVRISDNERRRISQELHDGICQLLTGARLRFAALEDLFASAGLAAKTQPLGGLLDEAVNHAYRLSRGLWTTDSSGKGELINLLDLGRQLSEQSGIDIAFEQKQDCTACTDENLTQVHYIAREAMLNAIKHSHATQINVILACDREAGISLAVRDDGRGMAGKGTGSGGMGISIMKHRAEMIGGTLWIGEAEGGGTTVTCTAPCGTTFTESRQ